MKTIADEINFAGIILSGGNSTRMGKDKYDLTIDGYSLLERTISILDPLVSQIIVVMRESERVNQRSFINPKVLITYDSISNQGPLQGIFDGVSSVKIGLDHIFLLSCDLPYLSTEWMLKLKTKYHEGSYEGVITKAENYTNPLIAVYHRSVLAEAGQLLASGSKRPIDLWIGKQIEILTVEENQERIVRDMNTPTSYGEAVAFYAENKKKE